MAMTEGAKRVRRKRATRPVYLLVRKLKDPVTGQDIGALVPANKIDARLLRERKFNVGKEIRAELKQPREAWQHRLIHKIGMLMIDNVDGWEQYTSHDAVKRLQRESGVCCEDLELDIPGVGKFIAKQAESLSFDDMDQDRFQVLFDGITEHIGKHFTHVMIDQIREEFWKMAGANRRST